MWSAISMTMGRIRAMAKDFQDDGHTVADMRGVSSPLGHPAGGQEDSPTRLPPLEGKERGMFILGALKAALLIALAFLGGLALVTFLLLEIWT